MLVLCLSSIPNVFNGPLQLFYVHHYRLQRLFVWTRMWIGSCNPPHFLSSVFGVLHAQMGAWYFMMINFTELNVPSMPCHFVAMNDQKKLWDILTYLYRLHFPFQHAFLCFIEYRCFGRAAGCPFVPELSAALSMINKVSSGPNAYDHVNDISLVFAIFRATFSTTVACDALLWITSADLWPWYD